MRFYHPPATEDELIARANELAGQSIKQVAQALRLPLPANQRHNKGWVGTLAESYLVATASNLAEPDFQQIGVELKTVPVNKSGNPKESTYVSTLALTDMAGSNWEKSSVYIKLRRILWLPIESDNTIPLAQRRFGNAILWSPTAAEEAVLRNDWEEIMELAGTGNLDQISASQGKYLQIRPKAASAASLGKFYTTDGNPASTLPRGFYLRAGFTRTILCKQKGIMDEEY